MSDPLPTMRGREIVRRTIDLTGPPRLAFDYFAYGRRYTDIVTSYLDFSLSYDRQCWVEGNREFYRDAFGNLWARVVGDRASKGEVHRGALQNSWAALDRYTMPPLAAAAGSEGVRALFSAHPDRFRVGCLVNASFSILSKLRGFQNLMEDLLLEPGRVREACALIEAELIRVVKAYSTCGADGIHIMEDWGSQDRAFMSRACWESFFAEGYHSLCEAAHEAGMKVILHTCGKVDALIPGFLDCGVDVLQLDQTANYSADGVGGIERLAASFAGQVTFFCPVDIQATLVSGDRARIAAEARRLVAQLGTRQGGFIAKSYGRGSANYLQAIGCDPAWNDYAFECFVRAGEELFGQPFDLQGLELPQEASGKGGRPVAA